MSYAAVLKPYAEACALAVSLDDGPRIRYYKRETQSLIARAVELGHCTEEQAKEAADSFFAKHLQKLGYF